MKFSEFPFNVPNIETIKETAVKLINEFVNSETEQKALKAFYKYADFEKETAIFSTIDFNPVLCIESLSIAQATTTLIRYMDLFAVTGRNKNKIVFTSVPYTK
jgi:hypothetical protein